jgi:hypothetical protein
METIQVVLDAKLLRAADRAARRAKQNRSALEERDREGYKKAPPGSDESLAWETETAWPGLGCDSL